MSRHDEDSGLAKKANVLRSPAFAWLLICLWMTYSGAMLWQLKQQSNWNASVCMVPR